MTIRATIARHPARFGLLGLVLVAIGAFAVYWFGPQYLFIDRTVNEALPTAAVATETPAVATTPAADAGGEGTGQPAVLARGEFQSLEHDSSGRALIVRLPDGSVFLRLEDLETSNGPDLRVILSSVPPSDDAYAFDDAEYVDVGGLKGNLGSSNYEIPQGLDLSGFRSAVVWCRRFSVGFAVAPLDPVG